jgi:hypothetical protein
VPRENWRPLKGATVQAFHLLISPFRRKEKRKSVKLDPSPPSKIASQQHSVEAFDRLSLAISYKEELVRLERDPRNAKEDPRRSS